MNSDFKSQASELVLAEHLTIPTEEVYSAGVWWFSNEYFKAIYTDEFRKGLHSALKEVK